MKELIYTYFRLLTNIQGKIDYSNSAFSIILFLFAELALGFVFLLIII